ncbi:hypothetical protein Tco_0003050 [Tanacetum coccineum]
MSYYPNYQPQFVTQEELLMFQQFKMQQMHQQQPQQSPNQFTTSQPHSEQQSHHLEVEDTEDEEEPLSTPTSKPSRGGRLKSNGENDDDHMSRVHTLYDATVGGEFKHRSAWLFLKGKHKWTNPDSTLQRRSRLLGTDEEPEHFGDDELPRPPDIVGESKGSNLMIRLGEEQFRQPEATHGKQLIQALAAHYSVDNGMKGSTKALPTMNKQALLASRSKLMVSSHGFKEETNKELEYISYLLEIATKSDKEWPERPYGSCFAFSVDKAEVVRVFPSTRSVGNVGKVKQHRTGRVAFDKAESTDDGHGELLAATNVVHCPDRLMDPLFGFVTQLWPTYVVFISSMLGVIAFSGAIMFITHHFIAYASSESITYEAERIEFNESDMVSSLL